ncbi:MAG: hypothetical protein JNM41_15455 [Flavipsychrobacter sp.]|nr:hypothetical protein [Flavipsychrobacter sp.]
MSVVLTDFERALLNRVIPTYTLNDSKGVQIALRNFIGDEREQIMADQGIDERAFRALQSQTVKNIIDYLKANDYIAEREGGVTFLTEKGKILRKQGSLEKYDEWQKETRAKNKVIIRTIETRGYLDQDEIIRNKRSLMLKRIRKFVVFPLLGLILLFLIIMALHKNGADKNIPLIRDLFQNEKTQDEKTDEKSTEESHTGKKKSKQHK